MNSVPVPAASNPMRPVLPNRGVAVVKSVPSGDTVVLLGRASKVGGKPPEVLFTFERVTAPRMASKANNHTDEPGAFSSREWLRSQVVGKSVAFETRKQGATAGDRVYGIISLQQENLNLAVESVRLGHCIPKFPPPSSDGDSSDNKLKDSTENELLASLDLTRTDPNDDPVRAYDVQLHSALSEAKTAQCGVHTIQPLIRTLTNANDDFPTSELVALKSATCVIEHVFDGSRVKCLVTSPGPYQYAAFTLIFAGINSPRVASLRAKEEGESSELYAEAAKHFVEVRLLHRELEIRFYGTDKSGVCAVGMVNHPRGNIGVEILKVGFARLCDWSGRMMPAGEMPAYRVKENEAKRTRQGIWNEYQAPTLSSPSEIAGTVIEVLTGDTLNILPYGQEYSDESQLRKISLASIRAPRMGNEKQMKPDEPYAFECKDRLRLLTVGKTVKVTVNYERDIPIMSSDGLASSIKRVFGTISVGRREDVGQVLVADGLAETQRHRDNDEKSHRYDELVAAEAQAQEAKKGLHSSAEYGRRTINDLTDPRKANAYSGSLFRAKSLKAIVEYVFNGSRFKVLIPGENCHIVFALENLRCPQPSPPPYATRNVRAAEPFGDASKRHARLNILQRTVDIECRGVTKGGVITGTLHVGQNQGGRRPDYALELLSIGYAIIEQRKIDYGEAPQAYLDAALVAQTAKLGLCSLASNTLVSVSSSSSKRSQPVVFPQVTLCEVRNGKHFFFQNVNDDAVRVIDASMAEFTSQYGLNGSPCDLRPNKIVAAIFNDGHQKRWYRAKILSGSAPNSKTRVLFLDYGNCASVSTATELRPLDVELMPDRVPAVAREAELVLTRVRSLEEDEGVDAARLLQKLAWGKTLKATVYYTSDESKIPQVALQDINEDTTIQEQMCRDGLALTVKPAEINAAKRNMSEDGQREIAALAEKLKDVQKIAKKSRSGLWRYGDIGEEDEAM